MTTLEVMPHQPSSEPRVEAPTEPNRFERFANFMARVVGMPEKPFAPHGEHFVGRPTQEQQTSGE